MLYERANATLTYWERARRLELQIVMCYRADGEGHRQRGLTRNISRSGVLFHDEGWSEPSTPLEMGLVTPKKIMGKWAGEVVCRGTVTRSERPGNDSRGAIIATRIPHYQLVRP